MFTNIKTLHALRSIDIRFLIFSLILICLSWCFDVLRLKVLTNAVGVRIPFIYGTKAILTYAFLSNITPSSAGGEPILFYMLNQKGITYGKASAIAFLRIMITMMFFAIGGPIIIYFHRELLSSVGLMMAFDYVAIFLAVTVMFFSYLYFAPHSARRGLDLLFNYLKEFLQGERWRLILVIFYTALMIASQFLVAPMILKGLGCDVGILSVCMIQGVLNFMLYYVPTPGGSGVSEGLGYALFAPLVPSHVLGIFLVIWKFLTNYVWTIVGGLIIAKSIGMENLKDITKTRYKD